LNLDKCPRTMLMQKLEDAVEECYYKTCGDGRIRDLEKAKARTQYYRTMAYLVNSWRQLAKDLELEELKEEIENIKQNQGCESCR